MASTAPGSYLLICDAITTDEAQAAQKASDEYNDSGAVPYHTYPLDTFRSRFDGLELVEPGLVSAPLWRPDARPDLPSIGLAEPEPVRNVYGGLARKAGA